MPESTTTEISQLNVVSNTEIGITLVTKELGYKYNAIKITKGRKAKSGYIAKEIKEEVV